MSVISQCGPLPEMNKPNLQWTWFKLTLRKSPVKYLLLVQLAEYCLFSYNSRTVLQVLSNVDGWKSGSALKTEYLEHLSR